MDEAADEISSPAGDMVVSTAFELNLMRTCMRSRCSVMVWLAAKLSTSATSSGEFKSSSSACAYLNLHSARASVQFAFCVEK